MAVMECIYSESRSWAGRLLLVIPVWKCLPGPFLPPTVPAYPASRQEGVGTDVCRHKSSVFYASPRRKCLDSGKETGLKCVGSEAGLWQTPPVFRCTKL